jgi:ABC-2 type transport system ATP-binding protein
LTAVLDRLTSENVEVLDIGLRRPTLDDVFLTLTGRVAEEDEEESSSDPPATKAHNRRTAHKKEAP